MRMWMVSPLILCQKHLCREHVELHMFLGTIKSKKKIDGYLDNNLLEPSSIYKRHDELCKEMIDRGYNHKSPITKEDCECISNLHKDEQVCMIDKKESMDELISRCPLCRKRCEDMIEDYYDLVTIKYKNYKGKISQRKIIPKQIRYDSTKWHPKSQWLLDAFDIDKMESRSFAIKDILSWR